MVWYPFLSSTVRYPLPWSASFKNISHQAIKPSSHAEPIISRAEEPYQDTCGSVNPPRHRTYEFTLGFARPSQPLPAERRGADACATSSNGFPSHRLLASWENLEITCMSGEVTWHQPFRCFPKDSVYDAKVQTWQKFVTFFLWNFLFRNSCPAWKLCHQRSILLQLLVIFLEIFFISLHTVLRFSHL